MRGELTRPRFPTALFATVPLLLVGCAAETENTGTRTETTTETGETAPTTPAPNGTTTGAAVPTDPAPTEELPYGPVGSETVIAGEPATICIHGDGWGTTIWAGNANTSCEFVIATHEVLIEGLNATEDDIRDHLRERITVHSPVTGQDHRLTCLPRGERLVTCAGGENAAVHFH